eukprot:TRINITY_DN10205_c0_g1_i1.p1 TRINITY_DN10205_c0_g1~~TRINITY_DN10205_c0_g1_i1.p1  ORF type:complete len:59 (+),score=3.53 TRINITY_DN10205_c0_g1_i1:287-463(+)
MMIETTFREVIRACTHCVELGRALCMISDATKFLVFNAEKTDNRVVLEQRDTLIGYNG